MLSPLLSNTFVGGDIGTVFSAFPEWLMVASPFIYIVLTAAAGFLIGFKGKKELASMLIIPICMCSYLGVIGTRLFLALTNVLPEALLSVNGVFLLICMYLSIGITSAPAGFTEVVGYDTLGLTTVFGYAFCFLVPVIAFVAYKIGYKIYESKKEDALSVLLLDLNEWRIN